MEIDDFVETSDAEELQELEDSRKRDDSYNSYPPRKRVKLSSSPTLQSPEEVLVMPDEEIQDQLRYPLQSPEEVLVLPEEEEIQDQPRYPLRTRNAAQLQPYTIEQMRYKQALRANPEAIVRFKNLDLRSRRYHPEDRYEEDGETQKDAYTNDGNGDEVASWKERERRRHRRREETHYEEDAGTQKDALIDDANGEDANLEEKKRRQHQKHEEARMKEINERSRQSPTTSHALSERQPPSSPEILQDFSSTDEGEATKSPLSRSQSKQSESSEVSDIEIQLPRSKQRALARMFPKSMANALVKQAAMSTATKKHGRSSTPPASDSDDEGPLLPGHTRTRKATYLKDVRDIKGDSESEQEFGDDLDTKSGGSSTSEEVEFVHSFHHRRRAPRISDLVSDSDTSSDDEMDDLTIQTHIADSHTPISVHATSQSGSGRLRDVNLIDWMLSRTRTIGGKPREHKKEDSGRKQAEDRPPKQNIVTRKGLKYGHERQTLLSFDGYGKSKRGGYRHQDTSTPPTSYSMPSRASDQTSNEDGHVLERDHGKMSWKERKKARRARVKKQGLYTFASKDQTHIERGRRETAFITVDLQDDEFHYALAPQHDQTQTQNWAMMFKPISEPPRPTAKISNGDKDQQVSPVKPKKKKQERIIPGDLGIPLLHSGKGFGLFTYIRKGWLHELLGLVASAQEPVLPPSVNSCGFDLGPTMGADKLISILQDICNTLFEFVTDLPEVDSDITIRGAVIMRVVPLLISWFRKTEDETVFASLREAGEREITRLVGKIQRLTLPVVDMPILATCWFAVEMCVRVGCHLEGQPPTGILKESTVTLMHLLLQVGLEKPIIIVKSDSDPTEPSVPHFAAELWVSLVHLLGECDSSEMANRGSHPFWSLLVTTIQSQSEGQKAQTNLEASETIWYIIFSICALSQYSVHGMTTGLPRLPACWDLVVFALKKIRLNEDPKMDLGMPSAMLLQRDKYIGLVMTRCFHLRERWRWKFDNASNLFNQLAVIFRSRKFVNLRHEGTGYPRFFKDRNWDLLASYDPKDTAFVIFVKLIVQAAKDDQGSMPGKLSLKVKKLLSLAVPVTSLPFSKANPPTLHELTMFYNRLTAVAIAIYLELDGYDFRTRQAREYINFADADDTTRCAVIGGMMNWAIMMVNREIKLDAIAIWIGEMAQVLSVELKETNIKVISDETNNQQRDRLILLSCALLGAVRHISIAYNSLGRYPDPSLLLSLKPIMQSLFSKENSKAQGELGLLADSFFSARSAAVPPPGRPVRIPVTIVNEDNGEESQDYGVMDIDINWSSVDIPEALAVDKEEKSCSLSNVSHDKTLASVLATVGFRWIIYRVLKSYFIPPPPSASFQDYAKQCDMWLRCAVGCTCMEVGDHKWDFWFRILDPHLTEIDDSWVRRVKLSLMLNILRADPMAYLTYMDRFIDTYLCALGSESTILEKDYVSFLLSIDNLQHPLLCNAQCLPERSQESEDYKFTVEQFLELRLPLLRVVFSNLDRLLREQHVGDIRLRIDNDRYLAKCCQVFSIMRSTRISLEGKIQYSDYNDFYVKVFQSLQDYPTLRMAENMSFWVDLGRISN